MSTLGIQRHIMAMLGPLMGTRVNGEVTAYAAGDDVEVCKGMHLLPLRRSQQSGQAQLVRTDPYVVTEDTVVTSAGTVVPIRSTLGGARQNIQVGDMFRWDPPHRGLEPLATAAGATTDAQDAPDSPMLVRSIVPFQDAGGLDPLTRLFNAQTGPYPSLVVAAGGGSPAKPAQHNARGRTISWRIFLIMGGMNPQLAQDTNTLPLLDEIESRLVGNNMVDGIVFSAPMTYGGRNLMQLARGGAGFNTAWAVTVRTQEGIPRYDDRTDFKPWRRTSVSAGPASADEPPNYLVHRNIRNMP